MNNDISDNATFALNTRLAKIQGLSVQVGELFADLYHDPKATSNETLEALEAYKSLRRMLPREGDHKGARHIGRKAAHLSTQWR